MYGPITPRRIYQRPFCHQVTSPNLMTIIFVCESNKAIYPTEKGSCNSAQKVDYKAQQ